MEIWYATYQNDSFRYYKCIIYTWNLRPLVSPGGKNIYYLLTQQKFTFPPLGDTFGCCIKIQLQYITSVSNIHMYLYCRVEYFHDFGTKTGNTSGVSPGHRGPDQGVFFEILFSGPGWTLKHDGGVFIREKTRGCFQRE